MCATKKLTPSTFSDLVGFFSPSLVGHSIVDDATGTRIAPIPWRIMWYTDYSLRLSRRKLRRIRVDDFMETHILLAVPIPVTMRLAWKEIIRRRRVQNLSARSLRIFLENFSLDQYDDWSALQTFRASLRLKCERKLFPYSIGAQKITRSITSTVSMEIWKYVLFKGGLNPFYAGRTPWRSSEASRVSCLKYIRKPWMEYCKHCRTLHLSSGRT